MKKIKKLTITLLTLAVIVGSLAVGASAYEWLDTTDPVTLEVCFIHGEETIPGAEFSLYRVADIAADATFTLAGDFAGYPVSLVNLDTAGWRALAGTLAGYAHVDGLVPIAVGTTDENGVLDFGSLSQGMYLVIGKSVTIGQYTYTAEPFLISLPDADEFGVWVYDVTAVPKSSVYYDDGESGENVISRKVLKVWTNETETSVHPEEITVYLLQDGEIYDTVTLNDLNSWRYTWKELGERHQWTVVEEPVEGYTVSVSLEGATFVITNRAQDVPIDPVEPDPGPDEPGPDNPDPDDPKDIDDPTDADRPGESEENLAQTGVLWWPVPALAAAGLVLVCIGILVRRREHEN